MPSRATVFEIYGLRRAGLTNKQIAERVGLATATVAQMFCEDATNSPVNKPDMRWRKCLRCGHEIHVPRFIFRCPPCRSKD